MTETISRARGPTSSTSQPQVAPAQAGPAGQQAAEGKDDLAEEAQHLRGAVEKFHRRHPDPVEEGVSAGAAAGDLLLRPGGGQRQQVPDPFRQAVLVGLDAPVGAQPEQDGEIGEEGGIPGRQVGLEGQAGGAGSQHRSQVIGGGEALVEAPAAGKGDLQVRCLQGLGGQTPLSAVPLAGHGGHRALALIIFLPRDTESG